MATGRFTLWPGATTLVTVQQTSDGPRLEIGLTADGLVVLSWPVAVEGFQLQFCTDRGQGDWRDEKRPIVDTATSHTVTVPGAGRRCYRLKK